MKIQKHQMLLFSLRLGEFPYKYKLYFAELDSVNMQEPVIHCFCIRSRKLFMSLELGGVYSLTVSGVYIKSIERTDRYNLTEDNYMYLLDTRDMIFMDDKEREYVGLEDDDYDPKNLYYSLKTAQQLYRYRPSRKEIAFRILLKGLEYTVSILIPILLFLIYVFSLSNIKSSSESWAAPFVLPLAGATSMPFMFHLMSLFYRLGESLLLNTPATKFITLQKYFLLWAGMKKGLMLEEINSRILRNYGIGTLILCFFGAVFMLII